jgi:3-phosphoshikimate 1-carboxyvinyltransferase
MAVLKITFNKSTLADAIIQLNGSKSISNRVLMIQALSKKDAPIYNLSTATDTAIMNRLLKNSNEFVLDAGDAGTAFRFMTAYLALLPGKHFLTGSPGMLKRPISVLVESLNSIGAKITYAGKSGYPPLSITGSRFEKYPSEILVDASVSSQYISALLMIAPYLPDGLTIKTAKAIVSEPYIDMTISVMQFFGAQIIKSDNLLSVSPGKYILKPYTVESDWSAASYYYAFAAISSSKCCIGINTLYEDSLQGDSRIAEIMKIFGVRTVFYADGQIEISNDNRKVPAYFEYDFNECPDLAQTMAVICAALNIPSLLKGLKTLKIKETDRILALKTELEQLGAEIVADTDSVKIIKGIDHNIVPKKISTWNDHRMAMSFAPLVLIYGSLTFDDADVVEKSYPGFWEDLRKIGIGVK